MGRFRNNQEAADRLKATARGYGQRLLESVYEEAQNEITRLASLRPRIELPARSVDRASISFDACIIPGLELNWRVTLLWQGRSVASGQVRKILVRENQQDLVIVRLNDKLDLRPMIESPFQRSIQFELQFENPDLVKRCQRIYHAIGAFKHLKCSETIARLLLGDLYSNEQIWSKLPKELPIPFNIDFKLDKNQTQAILFAISRELTIIEGVVGSGKTHLAACIAHCLVTERPNCKVLVCSPQASNVEQLIELLAGSEGKHHMNGFNIKTVQVTSEKGTDTSWLAAQSSLPAATIVAKRSRQVTYTKLKDLVNMHLFNVFYHRHQTKFSFRRTKDQLEEAARRNVSNCCTITRKRTQFQILQEADIVCCTTWQAGRQLISKKLNFDVLIIDDAHLTSDAELLIPMMYPKLKQLILLGQDLQKLKMTTRRDPKLNLCREEQPLFTRLVQTFGPHVKLERQYRSHDKLIKFCNDQYYEARLKLHRHPRKRFVELCVASGKYDWLPGIDTMSFVVASKQANVGGLTPTPLKWIVDKILDEEKFPRRVISIVTNLKYLDKFQERQYRGIQMTSINDYIGRENDFVILLCLQTDTNVRRLSHELEPDFTRDELMLHLVLTRARLGLFVVVPESMIELLIRHQEDHQSKHKPLPEQETSTGTTPWIDLEDSNYSLKWKSFIEYHHQLNNIIRLDNRGLRLTCSKEPITGSSQVPLDQTVEE